MSNTLRGEKQRDERKQRALARQRQRDELTPGEQLANLDDRLGVGVGAERERTRLLALVHNN